MSPRTVRHSVRGAAATAVLLSVAGCGGFGSTTTSTSSTPTPTSAPTPPMALPTTTATSTPDESTTLPTCRTANLSVTLRDDQGGGTAGSTYSGLAFTNTSSAACAMYGWPGVSYVGRGNGTQLGAAASRTGTPKVLTVAAGGTVVARLREVAAADFDADACNLTQADGLRVYPPNQRAAVFVPHRVEVCKDPATRLLTISPVTP